MDGVQVFLFETTKLYTCSTTKIFPDGYKHSQMIRRSSITVCFLDVNIQFLRLFTITYFKNLHPIGGS